MLPYTQLLPPFSGLPAWPCPSCGTGVFRTRDKSIHLDFTARSRYGIEQDLIHESEAENVFSCLMGCSNPECKEVAGVIGTTSFEEEVGDFGEQLFLIQYTPRAVFPAPALFSLPDAVPKNCCLLMYRAFALYWSDRKSAANALRAVLEAMLDDKGFTGKSLSVQILALKKVHPELEDYAEAVRMVGNHGSHTDLEEHSHKEMLDALEAAEHICRELYHDLKIKVGGLLAAKGKPKPKT
jgi:Domain of unknown function (DUF4145)